MMIMHGHDDDDDDDDKTMMIRIRSTDNTGVRAMVMVMMKSQLFLCIQLMVASCMSAWPKNGVRSIFFPLSCENSSFRPVTVD